VGSSVGCAAPAARAELALLVVCELGESESLAVVGGFPVVVVAGGDGWSSTGGAGGGSAEAVGGCDGAGCAAVACGGGW
jgi:hypothetical protein